MNNSFMIKWTESMVVVRAHSQRAEMTVSQINRCMRAINKLSWDQLVESLIQIDTLQIWWQAGPSLDPRTGCKHRSNYIIKMMRMNLN